MKSFAAALLLATSAEATSLRAQVEANLRLGGAVNCEYKCGLMWNQRNDWNRADAFQLYEYTACLEGCQQCNGGDNKGCQIQCKSTSWSTYLFTFNSARALNKIDNTAIAAPFTKCFDACKQKNFPTPGQGAAKDGKLGRSFMRCTKNCYNNYYADVSANSFAECEKGASSTCDAMDVNCYTKDQCHFGVFKGVVEPDKACISGCTQNLCQDGADCRGKGYWVKDGTPGTTGCQLITPQTDGIRNTIDRGYFGQQNDLGDCCNAALQRCGYAPGMKNPSFGVSLGHVIATSPEMCLDQSTGNIYGEIMSGESPYLCNCQKFFEACPGAMSNFPTPFTCYGHGAPITRT